MRETVRTYSSRVPSSAEDLMAWHARPGAFERLAPPWMSVRVAETRGGIEPGDGKTLRLGFGPLGLNWRIRHEAPSGGLGFDDVQESGPFAAWRHEHRFIEDGPGAALLKDRVAYRLPLGVAGDLVAGRAVERELDHVFQFRQRRTQLDLDRLSDPRLTTPLRVAITGSTGLVGRQFVAFLRAGDHEVLPIVRRPARDANEVEWHLESGAIDAARLESLDAVVHLAGASIAGGRWTKSRKRAIRESRVRGTSLLAETLAGLRQPPRVLVSTSAVGFYGDSGDAWLTEESPQGDGFLAEVCREWEAAAEPAARAGIRVVHPRFGVVLSGNGGMLALLARLFRLGLGGPAGNGRQFMSWIALDDLLGALLEAILNETLTGPVNAVAPEPVTNREFSKTLGRVLHRPAVMPAPAPMLQFALGGLANELLLASQRVRPAQLDAARFSFAFPTIESALRHELGRPARAQASVPASAFRAAAEPGRWR
jgi:uncharacterized protein (TIGR01777 family)